ncbi:MAG TPA: protein kinase [Ktedonobacterales bacterium]
MLNLEGSELGGCRLIRVVGEGGMGEVYLAEQLNAGNRAVAVKVVRPDTFSSQAQELEEIRERFKREVSLAANFSNPNILQVFYSGSERDYLYIVMVYAEEGSLSDAIRGRSKLKLTLPLDMKMTVDIVNQVASALQYIHDRGVVHRDVKPGNVLIKTDPDGHARMMLADFGVARGAESTTAHTQVAGTFTYMAPEQFDGHFSAATDQYALAVMTYQLLAGRPPFSGELGPLTRAHMYDAPPSLRKINPTVPAQVEAAIMRGLAKDPAQRFPSVTAFARALEASARHVPGPLPVDVAAPVAAAAGAGAGVKAPGWPGGPDRAKPDSQRTGGAGRLWIAALAAVVLLAAVLGAGNYIQNQQQVTAHATETAQANARLTANAGTGSPTATTQPGVTATSTIAGPTATTAPSTPPPGVGDLVFASAAPNSPTNCDNSTTTTWNNDGASTTCEGTTAVTLSSPKAGSLACLSEQAVSADKGYFEATVSPVSGKTELGFRQGVGAITTGTSYNIMGYYLAVDTTSSRYILYSADANGTITKLQDAPLIGAPPSRFTLGIMFNAGELTPYVNGHAYPSVMDTKFSNGWTAICSDGSASFSNVALYKLA